MSKQKQTSFSNKENTDETEVLLLTLATFNIINDWFQYTYIRLKKID